MISYDMCFNSSLQLLLRSGLLEPELRLRPVPYIFYCMFFSFNFLLYGTQTRLDCPCDS